MIIIVIIINKIIIIIIIIITFYSPWGHTGHGLEPKYQAWGPQIIVLGSHLTYYSRGYEDQEPALHP